MKKFLWIVLLVPRVMAATFVASAQQLESLDQLEKRIKDVAVSAKINDWDERIARFKKHLEVLKSEPDFADAMKEIRTQGFDDVYPAGDHNQIVLALLGFKPISSFPEGDQKKIKDLLSEKKIVDITPDKCCCSKPTIPFSVVFESYSFSGPFMAYLWQYKDANKNLLIDD